LVCGEVKVVVLLEGVVLVVEVEFLVVGLAGFFAGVFFDCALSVVARPKFKMQIPAINYRASVARN